MPTVTLRKRKISGGRYSLYADTYPAPVGQGRTKSLNLYIPQRSAAGIGSIEKKTIIATAAQICQRQANELAKPEIYSMAELDALKRAEKGRYSFAAFCRDRIGKIHGNSYHVYQTAVKYFFLSLGQDDIQCGAITQLQVDEFRDYLPHAEKFRCKGRISQNSAATYMAAFKGLLSDAYKGQYLIADLAGAVKGLSQAETNPEHLTPDELITLFNTPCNYPLLKQMAMFSAMTGLRFSDCKKLDRTEIKQGLAGYYIVFAQQKGGAEEQHPITKEALDLLPPSEEKPFSSIDYNNMQRPLKAWLAAAGIFRDVTFHSFRHSYAMMLLGHGVDIFTISKLMNHKSLRSTQVYARVQENIKAQAAAKIELNLHTPSMGKTL